MKSAGDADIIRDVKRERDKRRQPEGRRPLGANGHARAVRPQEVNGEPPTYEAREQPPLILTTAEFITGFTPPDYLIDGLIQKRFLYSLTAPTGAGKTAIAVRIALNVERGWPLAGREVERGKVLFFAGENPDDVRMRWVKQLEDMSIDPSTCDVKWQAGGLNLSDQELRRRIVADTDRHGPFGLVIVDTSAAFFLGDDENNNAQMGAHARMLRSLTTLPNGPAVIVSCHPKKNADADNLLPRGGGAFLAEVDGNLVGLKRSDSQIVEIHWHGKFRGPDFAPIPFRIVTGTSPKLVDTKGRPLFTVTAHPVSESEVAEDEATARSRQSQVLTALEIEPDASLAEVARSLQWFYANGDPNKSLVNRTLEALRKDGRVKKDGGRWAVVKKGKKGGKARETIDASD